MRRGYCACFCTVNLSRVRGMSVGPSSHTRTNSKQCWKKKKKTGFNQKTSRTKRQTERLDVLELEHSKMEKLEEKRRRRKKRNAALGSFSFDDGPRPFRFRQWPTMPSEGTRVYSCELQLQDTAWCSSAGPGSVYYYVQPINQDMPSSIVFSWHDQPSVVGFVWGKSQYIAYWPHEAHRSPSNLKKHWKLKLFLFESIDIVD